MFKVLNTFVKRDEHSSKLVPKSPHTAQDAKINLRILRKKEICKRRFGFVS